MCVATRSLKYPLIETPSRGVMLLVAAPARNWRALADWLEGSAAAEKPERGSKVIKVKKTNEAGQKKPKAEHFPVGQKRKTEARSPDKLRVFRIRDSVIAPLEGVRISAFGFRIRGM